jgi:plastocyanin
MPQWPITIIGGTPATFNPNQQLANVGDEIFWSNKDSQPHWPGLVKADGTINTTFFMPNQIAPNSPSSTFIPNASGLLRYKCSLHPNESGSVQVAWVIGLFKPGSASKIDPSPLTAVHKGDVVVWNNFDSQPHTISLLGPAPVAPQSQSGTYTVNATVDYYLDGTLLGQIKVS